MSLNRRVARVENFGGGRNTALQRGLLPPGETPDDFNATSYPVGALSKRKGQKVVMEYSGTYGVTGLHKQYKKDGTTYLLVLHNSTLAAIDSSGTSTNLTTGLTANQLASFAQFRDNVYMANAADALKRITGTAVADAELVRSEDDGDITTVYAAGGGLSAGFYYYLFTAYYADEGELVMRHKNAPDDYQPFRQIVPSAGEAAATAGQKTTITFGSAGNKWPTGVTHMNIYRTLAQPTALGVEARLTAVYFFVGKLALPGGFPSAYDDLISDANLGKTPPFETLVFAPKAKYLAVHKNRLWCAGGSTQEPTAKQDATQAYTLAFVSNPSRLVYSKLYQERIFEGFIDVTGNDGDTITGIVSYNNSLIVFKRRSVHAILGASLQDFDVVPLSSRIGCVAPRSIAIVADTVVFLAEDGVYSYNGQSLSRVSNKIRPDILSIGTAQKEKAVGVAHEGRYVLAYSSGYGSTQDFPVPVDDFYTA